MTSINRFRDTQATRYAFMDEFLVVCPQCSACGCVVPRDTQDLSLLAARRIICVTCGYTKDWCGQATNVGDARDAYFGLPLWLQTAVGDNSLWAYNLHHLQFIEAFVRATLRERRADEATGWANGSMVTLCTDERPTASWATPAYPRSELRLFATLTPKGPVRAYSRKSVLHQRQRT